MNRARLRVKYYSQLIKARLLPKGYIRDADDFSSYIMGYSSKLSRKVMERLQYNQIKILDHSQIFCETCILILHMNRRNLILSVGENCATEVFIGILPYCQNLSEQINNKLYTPRSNFQSKFSAQYLQRETEYTGLEKMLSCKNNNETVVDTYIEYLLTNLSAATITKHLKKDLQSSILQILIPYEKGIRNDLEKGTYLFLYKYLLSKP